MEKSNWTKASVSLAIFGFINIVLFIALSSLVGQVFDMVDEQANITGVSSDVSPIIGMLRTVFGLMFVLSMIGLAVWFIMGGHEEEFEEY